MDERVIDVASLRLNQMWRRCRILNHSTSFFLHWCCEGLFLFVFFFETFQTCVCVCVFKDIVFRRVW